MTDSSGPVGEEEFQAWVDGRLAGERAAAVERYLDAHPEDRRRLSDYAEHIEQLRAAFAAEPPGVPARWRAPRLVALQHRRRRQTWMQVAAAILLCLLGGLAGFGLHDLTSGTAEDQVLAAAALAAHRTFAPEVRHPVEVPAAQQAHLGQWLSNRLGRPLVIPDLAADGLQLMGGRLLPGDAGPAAQLMYEGRSGERVTVYIRVGEPGDERLYRATDKLGAFLWIEGGVACVVVGPPDQPSLSHVGDSIYRQFFPQAPKDKPSEKGKQS